MDAVDLLKKQHREVEALFKQLENAKSAGPRQRVFDEIADALAVHATIEEKHFYPSVKKKDTQGLLLESLEEHLAIKRVIADVLDIEASDETFVAKTKVLQDLVEHHVEEEEHELFPKVKKLFDKKTLEEIAQAMQETADELLEEGRPRDAVPSETDHAAQI